MENSSSAMAAKKRKPTRTPGEDAEVIALSPASLTAASRFFCEVCGKGFLRAQNLQLHRRRHNLPWGLRTEAAAAARRRVYVCPVRSCPNHDPSKALRDLSGIKKHFYRKHGEKKFSCHRCDKKYAVHSDIRAHAKICGTKTFHCDCGVMFLKRSDLARHKGFCALILPQHIAKTQPVSSLLLPPPSLTLSMTATGSPVPSEFPASQDGNEETLDASAAANIIKVVGDSPSTLSPPARQSLMTSMESDFFGALMEPTLPLSFLCSPPHEAAHRGANASWSQYEAAALSATALLQKEAQVGSIYSGGSSFHHGHGLSMMSGFNSPQSDAMTMKYWDGYAMPENTSMVSSCGLPDSMVDRASPAVIFSTQQLQTLDFLGMGGGNGNGNDGGSGGAPFFGRLGFP